MLRPKGIPQLTCQRISEASDNANGLLYRIIQGEDYAGCRGIYTESVRFDITAIYNRIILDIIASIISNE